MARSPGRDTLISLEYRSPLTGGPALATLGYPLERLPVGARTRPRRETASSKRSTPCSAVSSDPATVPRSTTGCPAPSSRQSPTPTRSSPRKCPPSSSGRSPKTTPAASRSQRSPSCGSSPAIFAERQKLLLRWLPNAEPLDLPGLTHLLHAQDPAAVADGLAGFFARQPIPEPL
jgi:hypothetical protein